MSSIEEQEKIREAVRRRYQEAALNDSSGCGCTPSCCAGPATTMGEAGAPMTEQSSAASCCGDLVETTVETREPLSAQSIGASCCGAPPASADGQAAAAAAAAAASHAAISARLGYTAAELHLAPAGANLGLGCGNPQTIAALKPGEVVLDLGSGAGFDCFLAAHQVGPTGYVIGVDMTPEMVTKARANARAAGLSQVSFRLGEIEALPVADNLVDVIISNCVINLSPDKEAVLLESRRVLKPGGRLAISDVVATADLPLEIRQNLDLYAACAAGALTISEWENLLAAAGFVEISVKPKDESRAFISDWSPQHRLEEYILSAAITARKPLP